MLAQIPNKIENLTGADRDKEIARVGMIAELDAVNLYEQLAASTDNALFKKVLLDIAKEEKTHIGEFHALLLRGDTEQVAENAKGEKEVNEMAG